MTGKTYSKGFERYWARAKNSLGPTRSLYEKNIAFRSWRAAWRASTGEHAAARYKYKNREKRWA